MNRFQFLTLLLISAPAHAGLPLICHPIDIGNAKSLPWQESTSWSAESTKYNRANLIPDTLALLTPSTPIAVRMETMRRAAVYARHDPRLSQELANRLMERVLDATADGTNEAAAWFDAGYFAETRRQLAAMQKTDPAYVRSGKSWVQHAIRLGGKGMEPSLARMAD